MIIAMFADWKLVGSPIYASEQQGQTIAYISDVGADKLKPLFIAMGAASVVIFDLGFLAERWLRHRGALLRNTSMAQKVLSGFAIAFSLIGALGFILLSVFDTLRHPHLHDAFLALFIGGYVISAVFVCAEYQRLGIHNREYRVIRVSFYFKLLFIIIEVALAIAFGVLNRKKMWNTAAIVEWIIALIYTFWVLSFVIDFLPSGSPKHPFHGGNNGMDMQEAAESQAQYTRDSRVDRYDRSDAHYPSGTTASITNGYGNGHTNGQYKA